MHILTFNLLLHCINWLLIFIYVQECLACSKYILLETHLPDFACGKKNSMWLLRHKILAYIM